jgi:peroxiredoxin
MRLLILAIILFLAIPLYAQKEAVRIGDQAPDFSAESDQGELFDLQEMKGKVVVITFWSTNCPICDEEIPKLNRIASEFDSEKVVFLGLTMNQGPRLESFLKRRPFNFNIIPNSFGILLKYADKSRDGDFIMGYPSYFVIDGDGKVALKSEGFDKTNKLKSEIIRILKESKTL